MMLCLFVGSFGRLCHGVVYVQDETENCYEQKVLIKTITGRIIHRELCPHKYKTDNSQIHYLKGKATFDAHFHILRIASYS